MLREFGAPLAIEEVELADPKDGEVLVRLHACGVCGTDLFSADGLDPDGYLPTVLGHEGAGIVEHVGPDVTLVRPGDRVVTLFSPECGDCAGCHSELTNRCTGIRARQNAGYLPDGTTRLFAGGEPIRHYMGCSAFAEYAVLPQIALARVDPATPLAGASLFACGLTTGIGAAMVAAGVRAGSTCVVFGAGLVGLGAVIGCRLARAERIICVDLSEQRLAQARRHGATDVLVAGDSTVERVRELTGGAGADFCVEATGSVVAMTQAVHASHISWGRTVITGVTDDSTPLALPPSLLLTGRRVSGALYGGARGRRHVPALVDRWLAGEIDVDSLVSHRLPLSGVNEGLALLRAREGIRTVLTLD